MRCGPIRPQMTLALKKTRPPGQVKWFGWVDEQIPVIFLRALMSVLANVCLQLALYNWKEDKTLEANFRGCKKLLG